MPGGAAPGWWRGVSGTGYSGRAWLACGLSLRGLAVYAAAVRRLSDAVAIVREAARLGAARTLVGRRSAACRLARNARRVGTLRAVRSGRRYPVFGGQVAGRNYRIITRPRGGVRHEIMAVRGGELQQELAG